MQEIIKEIDAVMEENRKYRRDINEKLCEIRNKLGKAKSEDSDEIDIWKLAEKVTGLDSDTCNQLFGYADPYWVFRIHTPEHVRDILDEHFGTKSKTEDKKYEMGEETAWNLAANIFWLKQETLLNVFGDADPKYILTNYTPAEAKQLLDEYYGITEEPIKPGDRVDFVYSDTKTFEDYIFVGENIDSYIGIAENATTVTFFNRSMWDMIKRKE